MTTSGIVVSDRRVLITAWSLMISVSNGGSYLSEQDIDIDSEVILSA